MATSSDRGHFRRSAGDSELQVQAPVCPPCDRAVRARVSSRDDSWPAGGAAEHPRAAAGRHDELPTRSRIGGLNDRRCRAGAGAPGVRDSESRPPSRRWRRLGAESESGHPQDASIGMDSSERMQYGGVTIWRRGIDEGTDQTGQPESHLGGSNTTTEGKDSRPAARGAARVCPSPSAESARPGSLQGRMRAWCAGPRSSSGGPRGSPGGPRMVTYPRPAAAAAV